MWGQYTRKEVQYQNKSFQGLPQSSAIFFVKLIKSLLLKGKQSCHKIYLLI